MFTQTSLFDTIITKQSKKQNADSSLCPYDIPAVSDILKLIMTYGRRIGTGKLISDIFECGAISISNRIDFVHAKAREDRYLNIINSYDKGEREAFASIFSKIYALLSSVVYDDGRFYDYLGEIFIKCNQGNKKAGQFFTPYNISKLCAKINLNDINISEKLKNDEIITINDCCCGSGGMLVAALDVLKNDFNVNYTRNCFVDCSDIDLRCVHMTYLQLSLAGVPALVKHQDSLTKHTWSIWFTPALIFQSHRFKKFLYPFF